MKILLLILGIITISIPILIYGIRKLKHMICTKYLLYLEETFSELADKHYIPMIVKRSPVMRGSYFSFDVVDANMFLRISNTDFIFYKDQLNIDVCITTNSQPYYVGEVCNKIQVGLLDLLIHGKKSKKLNKLFSIMEHSGEYKRKYLTMKYNMEINNALDKLD